MNEIKDSKVTFKHKKRVTQLRRKNCDDSDDEIDYEELNKLNILKDMQMLKKRNTVRGINIMEVMKNDAPNNTIKAKTDDTKMGGLTDMKTLSNELDLGNTFSVETNRRDEDTDMMKYIDEELWKRKGITKDDVTSPLVNLNTNEDVLFNILPQHLWKNNSKKNEEMLSNQMLNGIPEVELGIEERIRNIEATEEAKLKLMENKSNKTASTATFVPTNIAVCFANHNRHVDDDVLHINVPKRQKTEHEHSIIVEEPVVVIGDEPRQSKVKILKGLQQLKHPGKEKASDDYIFEKFKKQFKKF